MLWIISLQFVQTNFLLCSSLCYFLSRFTQKIVESPCNCPLMFSNYQMMPLIIFIFVLLIDFFLREYFHICSQFAQNHQIHTLITVASHMILGSPQYLRYNTYQKNVFPSNSLECGAYVGLSIKLLKLHEAYLPKYLFS